MFEEFELTMKEDLPLFKKLGLEPFKVAIATKTSNKTYVGEVTDDYGQVKIWVECMPAHSWMFEVYNKEEDKITFLSTGTGTLGYYWKSVEDVMHGMLVVDKCIQGKEEEEEDFKEEEE